MLGLAVICTAVAFLIFFKLIAEVGPARSTVITYVNPAVAVLLGVLVLNEAFTAATAVGFALILLGSVLATSRRRPVEPVVALEAEPRRPGRPAHADPPGPAATARTRRDRADPPRPRGPAATARTRRDRAEPA